MIVFLNGEFLPETRAAIPINDRGFMLGDGLFETIRVVRGNPFRFAQHLERLARGADFLKIKSPFTANELRKIADQLVEQNHMPEAVLRVTLTRGPGSRGYTPDASGRPTLAMTLHPAPPDAALPQKLVTSTLRPAADDPLASFKTTSKILNVLARAEAVAKGADEALLLNVNGEVTETAGGNLFWVDRDVICTAPTKCGALPGVTRAVVLEICEALGLKSTEQIVRLPALIKMNGIFITQSVLGVVPVKAIDGQPVQSSPVINQIALRYNERLVRD